MILILNSYVFGNFITLQFPNKLNRFSEIDCKGFYPIAFILQTLKMVPGKFAAEKIVVKKFAVRKIRRKYIFIFLNRKLFLNCTFNKSVNKSLQTK